jgi:hypothetical protein
MLGGHKVVTHSQRNYNNFLPGHERRSSESDKKIIIINRKKQRKRKVTPKGSHVDKVNF